MHNMAEGVPHCYIMRTCRDQWSTERFVRLSLHHVTGLVEMPFQDEDLEFKTNVAVFYSDLMYPDLLSLIDGIHQSDSECACRQSKWGIDEGCICPWTVMYETVDYKNANWNGAVVAPVGAGGVPRTHTSIPSSATLEAAVVAYEKAIDDATNALKKLVDNDRHAGRLWHVITDPQIARLRASQAKLEEATVNERCEDVLGD